MRHEIQCDTEQYEGIVSRQHQTSVLGIMEGRQIKEEDELYLRETTSDGSYTGREMLANVTEVTAVDPFFKAKIRPWLIGQGLQRLLTRYDKILASHAAAS